jgi:hypothetical protein
LAESHFETSLRKVYKTRKKSMAYELDILSLCRPPKDLGASWIRKKDFPVTIFGFFKSIIVGSRPKANFIFAAVSLGAAFPAYPQTSMTNQAASGAAASTSSRISSRLISYVWADSIRIGTPTELPNLPLQKIELGRDLRLKITRRYTFDISPAIDDFRTKNLSLSDGYFILRLVVTLPDVNLLARQRLNLPSLTPEQRYVTSVKKIVHFKDKKISETIPLKFNDISVLGRKTVLYVQLTPIESSLLKLNPDGSIDYTHSMIKVKPNIKATVTPVTFIPILETNDRDLPRSVVFEEDPAITNLDTYVFNSRKTQGLPIDDSQLNTALDQPAMDENTFTSKYNYLLMDENSAQLDAAVAHDITSKLYFRANPTMSRAALDSLLNITLSDHQTIPDRLDPTVARALCATIALENTKDQFQLRHNWIQKCELDPYSYLTLYKKVHVTNLIPSKTSGTQDGGRKYQLMVNFASNRSKSADISRTGSLGVTPSKFMGWVNYSFSGSETDSDSQGRSAITQSLTGLVVANYVANISLDSYKVCLQVNLKNYYTQLANPRGLYICSLEKQNGVVPESYHYMYEDNYGDNATLNQGLNRVIRGDNSLPTFMGVVERFTDILKYHPDDLSNVWRDAMAIYRREDIEAPGVISYPVMYESEATQLVTPSVRRDPSIVQRLKARWFGKEAGI